MALEVTEERREVTSTDPPPAIVFTGHHAYICTVAKVCKESDKFTDVKIVCADGHFSAHRLILGAASSYLRDLFLDHDQADQDEVVLVIPNMKVKVVSTLVDFLYTVSLNGLLFSLTCG